MSERLQCYRIGLWAEALAACFLSLKGYRILARRYKTPFGEIDLIARRGAEIVFAEVKARKSREEALEALGPRGRRRIESAARHYLAGNQGVVDLQLRFDLLAVYGGWRIMHLDNAWRPGS